VFDKSSLHHIAKRFRRSYCVTILLSTSWLAICKTQYLYAEETSDHHLNDCFDWIFKFYSEEPDFPYPMGLVQNTGNVLADMIPGEAPPLMAPIVKLIPHYERSHYLIKRVGSGKRAFPKTSSSIKQL
jgi:hypothetical protein